MMAPWPGISRGTEADVPSVPGFVREIVVPSKSETCSLLVRARVMTSSEAATNSRKVIFSAPLTFGTRSVREPSDFATSTARPKRISSRRTRAGSPPTASNASFMAGKAFTPWMTAHEIEVRERDLGQLRLRSRLVDEPAVLVEQLDRNLPLRRRGRNGQARLHVLGDPRGGAAERNPLARDRRDRRGRGRRGRRYGTGRRRGGGLCGGRLGRSFDLRRGSEPFLEVAAPFVVDRGRIGPVPIQQVLDVARVRAELGEELLRHIGRGRACGHKEGDSRSGGRKRAAPAGSRRAAPLIPSAPKSGDPLKRLIFIASALVAAVTAMAAVKPGVLAAVNPAALSPETVRTANELRDRIVAGSKAADWVRDITDLAGPRMPGSPGDRAAVALTLSMLKAQGFANVRAEKVVVPVWERGVETGEVLSPARQKLVLTALGGSIGTPEGGLEGEVVRFRSLEELALAGSSARGKIAFIDRPTARTSDGSGYGSAGDVRGSGPSAAARQGAIGLLIRSIGTDDERAPAHRRHALRGRRSEDPGRGARGPGRGAADTASRARARQSEVHAGLSDSSGRGVRQRHRRDPGTRDSERDRASRRAPRLVGPGHGRARRRRRMRHRRSKRRGRSRSFRKRSRGARCASFSSRTRRTG